MKIQYINTFDTKVNGIPCQCEVTHYAPAIPMRVGSSWGDAIEGEPEEFEFVLRDSQGYRACWLEKYITPSLESRLRSQYKEVLRQEAHWDY